MAVSGKNVICIIPETSVLLDCRNKFPCSFEGCGKVLPNYGALRLHLVKTHKSYQNEKDRALGLGLRTVDTMKYAYYCPVETCVFFCDQEGKNRPFTSMKNLKQHYQKVHADKNFKCDKCERGFGLERDKRRHEKTCGLLIKCKICDCPYSTVEALMTHCKRKEHELPEEYRGKTLIKCQTCGCKFSTVENLLTHCKRKKHEIPEEFCEKSNNEKSASGKELTASPNIIIINMMRVPNSAASQELVNNMDYRPILPKPVIGRTVPLTTVTMTAKRVLVEHQEVLEKQNVNTQTENALVEQGTCTVTTDVISTAVQAGIGNVGRIVGSENRDIGTSMMELGVMDNQLSLVNRGGQTGLHLLAQRQVDSTHSLHCQPPGLLLTRPSHVEHLLDSISQPTLCSLSNNSNLGHEGLDSNFGLLPTANVSSSKGMQTFVSLPPKKRKQQSIAVAETQTPGDYILKRAMASAQISLHRESKGSQVSPRAKVKGRRNVVPVHVSTQSCLTPDVTESPQKSQRKKKRRKLSQKDDKGPGTGRKGQIHQPLGEQLVSAATQFSQNLLINNSTAAIGSANIRQTSTTTTATTTTTNSELEMVLDGPHCEDQLVGTTAEHDDIGDHQTQTIGILEDLESLPSTTSTQTQNSFLTQTNNAGTMPEMGNIQHMETQTFVSAFTPDVRAQVNCNGFQTTDNTAFRHTPEGAKLDFDFVHQNTHDPPMNSTCQPSRASDSPVTFANSDAQTTATDLLNLLDTGIQADSGPGTTIQTQTDVDEMWELFCHNIETQTGEDLFLQDLQFSDIQIQTNLDLEPVEDNSSTVETQTAWHSVAAGDTLTVEQSDMETQTRFSGMTLDSDLTDSHTQTPWDDLTALIFQNL